MAEANRVWAQMTAHDALAKWDAGAPVWSCEMGGIGPGYEQCIQEMGFEMLRAMLASPIDWSSVSGEAGRSAWREYSDKIKATPNVKAVVEKLGPSGAQFGAAMNIASVLARHDYAGGMDMVPEDRRILVSKHFPSEQAA